MDETPIKILFVEDSIEYTQLVHEMLKVAGLYPFELTHVDRLSAALTNLTKLQFDVVLLDLTLPDSNGIDTFLAMYAQASEIPIVILTVIDDERLAVRAVQEGAQDYLVKGQSKPKILARTIRNAIERHRKRVAYQRMSVLDDLTGLYNRRGFFTLAKQHLKLAERAKFEMALVFADLDGLKKINDDFGHQEGDRALRTVATILRDTFRASDLLARLGGDEFMILAMDISDDGTQSIIARLKANLAQQNALNDQYQLTISFGVARFIPQSNISLEELIDHADRALYEHKRAKSELQREG